MQGLLVEEISFDRLDANSSQVALHRRVGVAGDTDDAACSRSTSNSARVGPIFPATPRMRMSPSSCDTADSTSGLGRVISSMRARSESISCGSKGMAILPIDYKVLHPFLPNLGCARQ